VARQVCESAVRIVPHWCTRASSGCHQIYSSPKEHSLLAPLPACYSAIVQTIVVINVEKKFLKKLKKCFYVQYKSTWSITTSFRYCQQLDKFWPTIIELQYLMLNKEFVVYHNSMMHRTSSPRKLKSIRQFSILITAYTRHVYHECIMCVCIYVHSIHECLFKLPVNSGRKNTSTKPYHTQIKSISHYRG